VENEAAAGRPCVALLAVRAKLVSEAKSCILWLLATAELLRQYGADEAGDGSSEADPIVTALPLLPNTGLLKSLEGSAPEVYAIGDCGDPQLIVDAIADGARIGRAF